MKETKMCTKCTNEKGLKDFYKNSKTKDFLGGDFQTVKLYIEKQFSEGMTWENHSIHGWHIDHIIPLSSAKTEEELKSLCHYTNLQPLWAKDNISKGAKLDYKNNKSSVD